jgi:hypothetical protein
MTSPTRLAIEAALTMLEDSKTKSVPYDGWLEFNEATTPTAMRQLLQEHDTEVAKLTAELAAEKERVRVLREALQIIKSQSIADDWTAAEALGFIKSHACAALTQTQPNPQEQSNG